jgi:glycosyltransferase involved in cell wall biosynthesis
VLALIRLVATLPCHNDAKFLETAVETLRNEAKRLVSDFVIVIAEDGSTDGSAEIARELATKDKHVLHIHADEKLGRGRALMNAWKKVDGDIYAYVDCDLATDMQFFPQLIQSVMEGCDLATGSRYVKGAVCHRPPLRRISSIVYNLIIRLLFRDGVYDHQCGFKAFSKRMVRFMLQECRNSDWFWDTEAIVLARRNGFKICEFPVKWTEKKGERTPVKRLIKDVWIHGKGIVDLLLRK